MDMITLIIFMCSIMWFVIDRFNELINWKDLEYGKWITLGVSAVFAFTLVYSFKLDIILALGAWEVTTTVGMVITGLALMGGSSLINKIAGLITVKKDEGEIETVVLLEKAIASNDEIKKDMET